MTNQHLTVTSQTTNISGRMLTTSAIISCSKENWKITTSTVIPGTRDALELAIITIRLPNGKRLNMNIQQLMALESIASNASKMISLSTQNDWVNGTHFEDAQESINELQRLVEMFEK